MTNPQHPITPPPELVAKLWREASAGRDDAPIGEIFNHGVLLAYAAGADQELEVCCQWLERNYHYPQADHPLRAARRPKPPSLKEQALRDLDALAKDLERNGMGFGTAIIRRALESLPND